MTSESHKDGNAAISLQHDESAWRRVFHENDLNDGEISYIELEETSQDSNRTDDSSPAKIHRNDVQDVVGRIVNNYVHTVVPSRPTRSTRSKVTPSPPLFDTEYEKQYRCWPPPVAMIIISIIEVIVLIYQKDLVDILIYHPRKRCQIWRWFTYMFVHLGMDHLLGNLLIQLMLGVPLEMVHGWWRVLIVYFAGGLAGCLGMSVALPNTPVAGASAGGYALMTAHVATIIMNWQQMMCASYQLLVFGVFATTTLCKDIYRRYVLSESTKFAYDAHLAGALAGLLVGINVLRNLKVKRWEKVVWWVSIFTYISLMTAAILWNILRAESDSPSEGNG